MKPIANRFENRLALIAVSARAPILVGDNVWLVAAAFRKEIIDSLLEIGNKSLAPALPHGLRQDKILAAEPFLHVEPRVGVAQQIDPFAAESIEADLARTRRTPHAQFAPVAKFKVRYAENFCSIRSGSQDTRTAI